MIAQFSQIISTPLGTLLVLALAAYLEVQGDACFQAGLYHSSREANQLVRLRSDRSRLLQLVFELLQDSLRQASGHLHRALLPRCPDGG